MVVVMVVVAAVDVGVDVDLDIVVTLLDPERATTYVITTEQDLALHALRFQRPLLFRSS